jgi:diketogulonate reductase-like aldo/keto reductase
VFVLERIANDRQVTPQFLSNQFVFLQTGAVVIIPRSTDPDHMQENLKVADWSLEPDEEFEMLGWTL